MTKKDKLTIKCGTHGTRVPAVVCGHLVRATDKVVGFVENSSDPDDLQAWCDECEQMFLLERELSDAFRKFNEMKVVCDFCYDAIRSRQSKSM